jgi:hypothetical protein
MWLSCISSEALRLQRGCGCLVSQVRHWEYREDVVVLYPKWGTENTERMWLSCISSEALRLQRRCGCLVSQVRQFSIWVFSSTNKLVCYTVLEMKIWNYCSESHSWIYFYIILNINWKKLLVQTKFYRCALWGLDRLYLKISWNMNEFLCYLTDFSYFPLKIVFWKWLDTFRTGKNLPFWKGV